MFYLAFFICAHFFMHISTATPFPLRDLSINYEQLFSSSSSVKFLPSFFFIVFLLNFFTNY